MADVILNIGKDAKYEFTFDEWSIIKKLIKISLNFESDSYELFTDLAINEGAPNVEAAVQELIQDPDECKVVMRLNTDKVLAKKLRKLTE